MFRVTQPTQPATIVAAKCKDLASFDCFTPSYKESEDTKCKEKEPVCFIPDPG